MQIEEKYELLEVITGTGGAQDVTVPAWERASGRLVFIHVLAGGYGPETNGILSTIPRLPAEHKQHVLGAGDLSGSAYVVTDALPWGASLRTWVASVSGQAQQVERPPDPAQLLRAGAWKIPVVKPGASPVNVSRAEPGEFTRMLGIAPAEAPAATAPGEPDRLAGLSSAGAPFSTTAEPGEFTRLMQTAQPAPETTLPETTPQESGLMQVVSPPREISAATAASPSTETDRNKSAGLPEMRPAKVDKPNAPGHPQVAVPTPPEAGEFTRILRRGQSAAVNPAETQEMVIPALVTPVSTPPPPEPGEFTLLMQAGTPAAPKTPLPVKPEPSSTAEPGTVAGSTMYVKRHPPMEKPVFPPASGSPAPPRTAVDPLWRYENAAPQRSTDLPPASSGPGEFTRMFHPTAAPSSGSESVKRPVLKQPAAEGEFTRMMSVPPVAPDSLFTPTAPPQADVFSGRPAPVERDEFSSVANAGRETPQQQPIANVEPSPGAKPKASNLPVILIVGGLLLITVVLVVVFAVMR
jgi:hypothetical protein